jgi:hypothetical protein
MKVEAPKIVDERRIEEQAIETVKYAAVSGEEFGGIFCPCTTFESTFS